MRKVKCDKQFSENLFGSIVQDDLGLEEIGEGENNQEVECYIIENRN